MNRSPRRRLIALLVVCGFWGAGAEAIVPERSTLADKVLRHPNLHIPTRLQPARELGDDVGARVQQDLAALGIGGDAGFYDPRAGRLTSLILSEPLVPGSGVGNDLGWGDAGAPADEAALGERAWAAVRSYLQDHESSLRVDVDELAAPRVGIFEQGNLIHVYAQRVLEGTPVRDSSVTATLNHGNLVLLGLENWGDAKVGTLALLGEAQAEGIVMQHVLPYVVEAFPRSELQYVPMAKGEGYEYRLVWAVRADVQGDPGTWEGLVDAATGELIAFEDRNQYSRRVVGGVFPLSNDGRVPDGVEQAGWPMPYANVVVGANTFFTTTGGLVSCSVSGSASTTLNGSFIRINDTCGAISETAAGDFDLGTSAGTDCTVPAGHSAGDTHSSRTGFYELNRIKEQARGYLPANPWLQAQLTANMNVNNTCNAFWNGSTVNFFRDSGSACRNTGEIAAVFDHEWGHGLDNNGTNPNISPPGEAIADIHAMMRLATSCVGRGFFKSQVCTGYGDACIGTPATGCTGVRDLDFAKHRCNRPHTITWAQTGFTSAQCGFTGPAPACPAGSGTPCGRETHCEGYVAAETGWDLYARDLQAAPFSFDSNTALELAGRLSFLGSDAIGSWYTCAAGCETAGTCGCGATGGYLLYLAADDDDGNLTNGTPHMSAIRAAFERHEIHCVNPTVANTGCAGGPTTAPVVTATAVPEGVNLTWAAVPNAARYFVYRTEGVAQCGFGKVKVAEVTTTSFSDTGLLGGRPYSYVVLPVGSNTSCFGRASACATATPTAVGCAADFSLSCSPAALTILQGGNGTSTCTVQSLNAFTSAVDLSCTGLPAGVTCSYSPGSVTPPAGGAASSTLTVTVSGATTPGNYTFKAQGVSGPLTRTFDMSLTVNSQSVAPFALSVDSGGNGVLQPNETVVVAPAWRNIGTVPISLSGATSSFTGPGGAVYANPDSSANYGTIGVGAQASCATTGNCYSVLVTAATRPLTHWDSTILETVSPTGTTKTWTLHIGDSFTDVPPTNGFYRFVETILHKGVTGGCAATLYCPADSTTREQMAVFVLTSKEPSGYAPPPCGPTPMFTDVPVSSPFCPWVEELARRGVVGGCGGSNYCPSSPATREQMAVFVLRTLDPALNPPACGTPMFGDVPASSPFCKWIEELARRGVVTGCGGGNYCPAAAVSREQMAVFLTGTFGLVLYGP